MNMNDKEFLVQKIRAEYTQNEHTKLDELKKLDLRVKRPARLFAGIFGGLGAIIMGTGMSLVMTDVGASIGLNNSMPYGIVIGCIGMIMVIINYPLYKRILNSRRKKYADNIIEMSDEIMRG